MTTTSHICSASRAGGAAAAGGASPARMQLWRSSSSTTPAHCCRAPQQQHQLLLQPRPAAARLVATRAAPSAGEVGPKKAKRSGKPDSSSKPGQQQQQQQQQGSQQQALAMMDYLEDDDEDEDANFLSPYMDAVVKVYCVHTEPNYSLPWQRKRQYTSTSTGFVAAGGERWLLTNAHSVDYCTQVKVKRRGDDQKFLARVLALGVDCDLALLTVDDPAFWEDGLQDAALAFGLLPRLQDTVAVVGYPIGGETISITSGVVSRIEVTQYSHGSIDLLGIQIDAAINGGNSGGPVFNARGQVCGIAFQGLSGSDVEAVGYVIPTPVVQHFLADVVAHGRFTGFPGLGVGWQRMESEALRRAYGMQPGQKGVLIRRVNPTAAAAAQLRPGDVLLSFDGVAIANDGTVPFRTGERIAFSHLISKHFVGDSAALEVLRDGAVLQMDVTLSKPGVLVPAHLANTDPSYFLLSGLVFTAACEPYLESEYGSDWPAEAPVKLIEALYYGMPESPGQQVVLLGQVLAHESTLGYEDVSNVAVRAVNGTRVTNLAHLAQLVADSDEELLRLDCDFDEQIVIDRAQALAGTHEVLAAHSIPAAASPDVAQALRGAWPPALQELPAAGGDGKQSREGAASGVAVVAAAAAASSRGPSPETGSSSSQESSSRQQGSSRT